tara:strand:- start:863 stop:976 length:114 start_codon:yes stop_codon:yes gene_type:complete
MESVIIDVISTIFLSSFLYRLYTSSEPVAYAMNDMQT